MSPPLVSVVIPSFNHAQYVVEAVESALAQSYEPQEIIVVDDGSTDDTQQCLAPYRERIRVIYQQNQGLSAARNTGIRAALGEWVAFLDADDLWHPQKTEVQLRSLETFPQADVIGSPGAAAVPKGPLPSHSTINLVEMRNLLTATPITGSSTLVRRRCFDEVGFFDTTLTSVEDRDMWLRLATKFQIVQVCSPCWTYRQHPQQMTRNATRMYLNYRRVLSKFFAEHPSYRDLGPSAWASLYLSSAVTHIEARRRLSAIGLLLRSIWQKPKLADGPAGLRRKLFVRAALGERIFRLLRSGGSPSKAADLQFGDARTCSNS